MVIDTLKSRGLVKQAVNLEGCEYPYLGFDVTADSLHVGHLLPLMAMSHFILDGKDVIFVLGGSTTLVGDPTGKSKARTVLSDDEIKDNTWAIKLFLINWVLRLLEKTTEEQPRVDFVSGGGISITGLNKQLSDVDIKHIQENTDAISEIEITINDEQCIQILNNSSWYWPEDTEGFGINYIDFITRYGKHFSVNEILKLDSVGMRLEQQEHMSFTEFNYMIMQAYDFYYLRFTYGCDSQVGGADQWGNIAQGVSFCRKMGFDVGGMTTPLLLTKDGCKMGKTENSAVWLNSAETSIYDYWQFFRNCRDENVADWVNWFTFSEPSTTNRDINSSKYYLALDATTILFGAEAALKAEEKAKTIFRGKK